MSFSYDEGYRSDRGAVPLSVSLPLSAARHDHEEVSPWLWGLLPDSHRVLKSWGRRFHVKATDAFGLLGAVGTDCAGAVQFVRPEYSGWRKADREVRWLSESELGNRLDELGRGVGDGRREGDPGLFTLAGAQPKTALLYQDGRWGVPGPGVPTNVLVKPANVHVVPGLLENEHFCLRLAQAVGLPVVRSTLLRLGAVRALVVDRYDRCVTEEGGWARSHQEDCCQALSVYPDRKYQNESGPGVDAVMKLLAASHDPENDRGTFMRALVFNFLVAGTDAHGKNYALRLGPQGSVRLAPLYDVASFLPYADGSKLRLAMKVGGRYHLKNTWPRHWARRAQAVGYPPGAVLDDLTGMAHMLPDLASDLLARLGEEGVFDPVLRRLVDRLAGHCGRTLARVRAHTPGHQEEGLGHGPGV